MATTAITGEVRAVYIINYDEESRDFIAALEGYIEFIDPFADAEDMVKKALYHVVKHGAESMIEGIGYVSFEGRIWGEPYCGISMEESYEDTNLFL